MIDFCVDLGYFKRAVYELGFVKGKFGDGNPLFIALQKNLVVIVRETMRWRVLDDRVILCTIFLFTVY